MKQVEIKLKDKTLSVSEGMILRCVKVDQSNYNKHSYSSFDVEVVKIGREYVTMKTGETRNFKDGLIKFDLKGFANVQRGIYWLFSNTEACDAFFEEKDREDNFKKEFSEIINSRLSKSVDDVIKELDTLILKFKKNT